MMLTASCTRQQPTSHHADQSDIYYTCSMHPQVVADKPGKCPICGMALIQATRQATVTMNELTLNDEQIKLGNIRADTIHYGQLNKDQVLTATLAFDQNATRAISARIGGRIERLYFKNTGDYVRRGDKLYDLYSDELNAAKQQYLLTASQQSQLGNTMVDYRRLMESAKNKLLLWGMSESQIASLLKSGKSSVTTAFYSEEEGYITSLSVNEGDYVMEGSPVMQLASLSTIWAEAQVYASQLSDIDRNGKAVVQFPDLGNMEVAGTVEFINPEINQQTRINLLRVGIPNPGGQLRPGMPAYVTIRNTAHNALSLPAAAVIRDSKGATVWVQTAKNTFAFRMVQTGLESGNRIAITSGLHEGDVVVVSGAYLLNSEYIFKHGADPMEGMKM